MKTASIFCFLWLYVTLVAAQPYANEISRFAQQDSISFPPKGETLFVGSSSFRLWHNLEKSFPEKKIINRGFGGSTLVDVIRYADRIIYPYAPCQVVIYCGENDIADGVAASVVAQRFEKLFSMIRARLPNAKIIYVSIKPSPSRAKFQNEMIKTNKMIRSFVSSQHNSVFVDVYNPMLTGDGKIRKDLFVEDDLHMNETGYLIWKKAISPVLD